MNHCLTSQWGRIALSPIKQENLEELRALRNRESHWFIYSNTIDQQSQQQWYKNYLKNPFDYMFKITELKNPYIFIGSVAVYNLDKQNLTGEFGRIIINHEIVTEKGLGLDSSICACQIGFEQLGLKTITLEVFETNIRAIEIYKKIGFVLKETTGTLICMSLSAEDFIYKSNH